MTTPKSEIPLGQLEDQRLEFKSAAVLDNPDKIAREVVAMLNAEGGEVWIGLREEDRRAVEIEPIPEAETRKERLLDYLIDTLEPAPRGDEVVIETVELPGDHNPARVLRITVKHPADRGPYAWLRKGGRHFETRVDARLCPMSREEIREAISPGSFASTDKNNARAAERALREAREEFIQDRVRLRGLWLSVRAIPDLALDVHSNQIERIATEPELTGNRRTGATFLAPDQPEVKLEGIAWKNGGLSVEILETGHAEFFAHLDTLLTHDRYIDRHALAEYPTSALRILGQVYAQTDIDFVLLADLALVGVEPYGFRPQTSFARNLRLPEPVQPLDGPDLFLDKPLRFPRRKIIEQPDLCAARLLRPIFKGFAEDLPQEFDFRSGRLILPE